MEKKLYNDIQSFKILKSLYEQDETKNVLLSPFSLEVVLFIMLCSSEGETNKKIKGYYSNVEESHEYYEEYMRYKTGIIREIQKTKTILNLENEISTHSDLETSDFVVKELQSFFNLKLDDNGDKTFKIKNELTFKAKWENYFSPHPMGTDKFYLGNGIVKEQAYIIQENERYDSNISYLRGKTFHAISIPFKDRKTCMKVYLPYENDGINNLFNEIDNKGVDFWRQDFRQVKRINLMLPEFEFEDELDLKNMMVEIGLGQLFENTYDFQKTFKETNGKPLFLEKIIQKVKINLNQTGVEAEATTLAIGGAGSIAQFNYDELIYFDADHPFLYTLNLNEDNTILFSGIYNGPEEEYSSLLSYQKEKVYKDIMKRCSVFTAHERIMLLLFYLYEQNTNYQLKIVAQVIQKAIELIDLAENWQNKKTTDEIFYEMEENIAVFSQLSRTVGFKKIEETESLFNIFNKLSNETIESVFELKRHENQKLEALFYSLLEGLSFLNNIIMSPHEKVSIFSIQILLNEDSLPISTKTIEKVNSLSQFNWDNVLQLLEDLNNLKYEDYGTIKNIEFVNDQYAKFKQIKNNLPHLTLRARVALGIALLEKNSSRFKDQNDVINFFMGYFLEFVTEKIPSQDCLDVLKFFSDYYKVGGSVDVIKNLMSVSVFESFQKITSNLYRLNQDLNIFEFSSFFNSKEHDYIDFEVSSMKDLLMRLINDDFELPDLKKFKRFQIIDDNIIGEPLLKGYFD